ncbi:MAG: hypothetical protein QNL86_02420 [Crocinitomicaceae bacterium]
MEHKLNNYHSYYSKETGLSIMVPSLWTWSKIGANSFRIFGLSEKGFDEYFEVYRPTMSFEKIHLKTNSLEERKDLIGKNITNMANDYNNFEIINEDWSEKSNRALFLMDYTWIEETTGLKMHQQQAFIFESPTNIILMNSAVIHSIKGKYLSEFSRIINSIRIINN